MTPLWVPAPTTPVSPEMQRWIDEEVVYLRRDGLAAFDPLEWHLAPFGC